MSTLCQRLLQDIRDYLLPKAKIFQEHGGIPGVEPGLLSMLRPEIRALQGHKLFKDLLDKFQAQSREETKRLFLGLSHLDVWTTSPTIGARHTSGCTLGHCSDSDRRIISQHSQDILRDSTASLHHLVLWMGNGHRTVKTAAHLTPTTYLSSIMYGSFKGGDWRRRS